MKSKFEENLNLGSLPEIFHLVTEIEEKFDVDSIKLQDGTKIWNLVRIILYFYPQKKKQNAEKQNNFKIVYSLLKENLPPLRLPRNIEICGFSGTESRKCINGIFYDIYMDPLYEILGNRFYVFEWPTPTSYRRNYGGKVYSKNYVPMHIPLFSKTFFNIGVSKLLMKENFVIKSRNVLENILEFYSRKLSLNKDNLIREIYGAITLFYNLKKFFIKILQKISPKAVLIRCGYGRFHMALSQACRELDIPSIELQHGIITKYHAGYVKATESENRDCVPEYILTYGNKFTSIIRKGSLFEKEKVVTVGFPYIEEVKKSHPVLDDKFNDFISKFTTTILVTSQWTVADKLKEFIIALSEEFKNRNKDIGIVFKPHPRDWREYLDVKNYENIFLSSKYDDIYEMLKVVDIHSTVYSTSGLEALAFGKPNIFIDVGISIKGMFDIIDDKSSFIVNSPEHFIGKLEYIISNYESISKEGLKAAEKFFKPNAKKNIANFLNSIGINIKNDCK